ncbi:MAG: hypothetical protein CEN91_222 [Candidatus Berkelbacteria bacterium Licking1014_85]|uniref:Uncharacterized protein n=1 Tax=Candidatus Berkelbacteria bacterium Licking1014_85 TaxID=2017148 RepID=A0A554LKY6_9BACT|nr:MAG: hypothetical protein CEN91_222 [Candidatus Berkelbacteria bacterium Licking1014_85]
MIIIFKPRNHNIILPKYLEMAKRKGSSLIFSAQGGWDKEKKEKPAAKKGQSKRGRGGRRVWVLRSRASSLRGKNSASPEPKPRTRASSVRSVKVRSLDFRQKMFELRPKNTAT